MKRCDSFIINEMGLPSLVLMERAALSVVEELHDNMFDLERVILVCGSGNNGGDGFAVARLLYLRNVDVDILFVGNEEKCTEETSLQMAIAQNYRIRIYDSRNFKGFEGYTTIVDSILGLGISKPVKGKYAEIIEDMNRAGARILSIDIPSGISADTGQVMGVAVRADKTVSLAYKKLGLVLYPGAYYAGQVRVRDIGITDIGFNKAYPKIYSYTKDDLARLPKRINYSNKGSYGKVLVIAGTVNMAGAAYLSAQAAYRMGAGLVNLYVPKENRGILQTMLPEAILTTYNKDNINLDKLKEIIDWASVIIMGPGLGNNETTKEILKTLLDRQEVDGSGPPLIIDADGINAIAGDVEILGGQGQNIILTPHLGEMARLVKKDIGQLAGNIIEEAEEFAKKYGLVCVLKDARTAVTDGGGRIYLNQSGNNGMATAGSGDVLTGVIGGLLAQGMGPLEGAKLGVYIHGLAGDKAALKLGQHAMIARDILDSIPMVIKG